MTGIWAPSSSNHTRSTWSATCRSRPRWRTLELACGTGILTRKLRAALPPESELIASDLNEAMLEYARRRPDAPAGVEWRIADMAGLPFPDGAFNAVVCQFGLMFVPDKVQALREVRRVLEPVGLFLFNVWDSLERNRFAMLTDQVLARLFPGDPPTFYQTPFGLHDRAPLRALLADAGFEDIVIDRVTMSVTATSSGDLARGLVEGNPVLLSIRERGTVPVERVVAELERALAGELGERPARVVSNAFVIRTRRPGVGT